MREDYALHIYVVGVSEQNFKMITHIDKNSYLDSLTSREECEHAKLILFKH